MKTKFYYCILLLALSFNSMAQLSNPGFEHWDDSGKPAPFDWKQPTGWISTNSLTEWTAANIKPYQPALAGDYSLQLISVNIGGGWPTAVCNGNPKLISDFSEPSIDIITGGEPINYRPVRISGNYWFDGHATDKAYGVVILKKYNAAQQKYDTLGIGDKLFDPNLGFESFDIDILYASGIDQPDSIVVAFYSTDPENPKGFIAGKKGFLIDELVVDGAVGICDCYEEESDYVVYPNPSQNTVEIQTHNQDEIKAIHIFTMLGQKVLSEEGNTQINIAHLNAGNYVIQIELSDTIIHKQLVKE